MVAYPEDWEVSKIKNSLILLRVVEILKIIKVMVNIPFCTFSIVERIDFQIMIVKLC